MNASLAEAYTHCEQVTREQARNFAWGIRLLRPDQRRALSAVYALCRRIDDIGDDGDAPAEKRLLELDDVRTALGRITPDDPDPVYAAVADVAVRYPLPMDAFGDLLDGVASDVRGETVPDTEALVLYCRRVAGSVGRMSLGVYGVRDRSAYVTGDDLGVGLQFTNILRDVREDAGNSRQYLPADALAAAGATVVLDAAGNLAGPREPLLSVVRRFAAEAEGWYARGLQVLPVLDHRAAACTGAMAGIYHRLNAQIARDPAAILTQRLSLSGKEKARVALAALLRRPV